ncbi:MAG TPA: membrane protein insertion efficiency factor YidD [Gammaproteobacteria bacterium]|nr:membrane protein insertion efficiency factor YidD [Gammaproteobacteria bacterium]
MRKIVIVFIRAYQYLLSPFMAPSCRYTPTCSEYAIESFQRFGFFRGLVLSVRRIFSCHPWHHGGYDPVPESFSLKPGYEHGPDLQHGHKHACQKKHIE